MNLYQTRVSVETVLPIYSTLKFEHRVKVCAFLWNRPSRLARKRELVSDINVHCNNFNSATVLSTVDLVSSGDKSSGYLRLGRKNVLDHLGSSLLLLLAGVEMRFLGWQYYSLPLCLRD
jgi:hypothetical protein